MDLTEAAELVLGMGRVEIEVADRARVVEVLRSVARMRGFLDSVEVIASQRLLALSPTASREVAEATQQSARIGERVLTRGRCWARSRLWLRLCGPVRFSRRMSMRLRRCCVRFRRPMRRSFVWRFPGSFLMLPVGVGRLMSWLVVFGFALRRLRTTMVKPGLRSSVEGRARRDT